jgi:hypothetical protein
MSLLGLVAVIGALALVDGRVRQEVAGAVSVDGAVHSMASAEATVASSTLWSALRDQSVEHAPLTLFVAVAAVLVMFMLKT